MTSPDYLFNLDLLNSICRDTFGSPIAAELIRKATGEIVQLTMINLPVVEPEESRNYVHLWVRLADCGDVEPAQGDQIEFEGQTYRIYQVRPEAGGGGALLRVHQAV